jgi:hypothetical protein
MNFEEEVMSSDDDTGSDGVDDSDDHILDDMMLSMMGMTRLNVIIELFAIVCS